MTPNQSKKTPGKEPGKIKKYKPFSTHTNPAVSPWCKNLLGCTFLDARARAHTNSGGPTLKEQNTTFDLHENRSRFLYFSLLHATPGPGPLEQPLVPRLERPPIRRREVAGRHQVQPAVLLDHLQLGPTGGELTKKRLNISLRIPAHNIGSCTNLDD